MTGDEAAVGGVSATSNAAGVKHKGGAKTSRIPVKVEQAEILKKPEWIRVKAGSSNSRFYEIKQILREAHLNTVCEEASCPNIGECFGKGTATFMIMGDKCTRIHSGLRSTSPGCTFTGMRASLAAAFCLASAR